MINISSFWIDSFPDYFFLSFSWFLFSEQERRSYRGRIHTESWQSRVLQRVRDVRVPFGRVQIHDHVTRHGTFVDVHREKRRAESDDVTGRNLYRQHSVGAHGAVLRGAGSESYVVRTDVEGPFTKRKKQVKSHF